MLTKDELNNLKKLLIFIFTPTIEVFVTQPLWSVMKQMQSSSTTGKPKLNLTPSHLYKGVSYNLGGFSLTIFMQMYMTDALVQKISDNPTNQHKTIAAILAGIASSLIACPTDALMTQQQQKNIKPKLLASLPATILQESTCSVFLLVIAPMLKQKIEPYTNNSSASSFLAGISSGMMAALISQPANTIRTFQQIEINQGFFKASQYIYTNYGLTGFLKGTSARFGMVTASLAVMTFVKDSLEKMLGITNSTQTNANRP